MMKMVYSDFVFLATCAVVMQMLPLQVVDACDCMYKPGGCVISTDAPNGYACRCEYQGAWTCFGRNTNCQFPSYRSCYWADTSYQSCLQGRGDCGGYECDCTYSAGGCSISTATSEHFSACKCEYMGAWTCSGRVVSCRWPHARACGRGHMSYEACLQGGGDCGGY